MNSGGRPLLAATLIALGVHAHGAWAQPTGGQIVAGSGAITQSGSATVIDQTSARLAANWTSFSINAGESVRFNQPSASSIALNRVLGQNPSVIMGSLSSNGQVFLLNPHGVLFGQGAQVNVGGLVASTLRMSDQDFMAGRYTLTGDDPTKSVVNQGALTAAPGGYIALIAPQVSNAGTIAAPGGAVALAAGNQVTLSFSDNQLVGLTVDQGAMNALAENNNLIQADGGLVILTAKGQDAVLSGVVNNAGIVQARTVSNVNGVIKLLGGMDHDTVQVSGTLDASAANGGDGGFIETSAAHVKVAPEATVTGNAPYGQTGNWLIDPTDYTVAASGGNVTGWLVGMNLGSINITIQTASGGGQPGDIFINDAISWTSANSLTLLAHNDVNVNAAITNTGTGGVTLRADSQGACVTNTATCGTVNFAGAGHVTVTGGPVNNYYNPAGSHTASPSYAAPVNYSGNVTLNGGSVLTSYMLVNDVDQLQAMNTNVNGVYALGKDIDASGTAGWNSGGGFAPISSFGASAIFDGNNHVINGLYIYQPGASSVGFIRASSGTVRNIGLVNGSVTGGVPNGGMLIGQNSGTVDNAYATGSVSGGVLSMGGLVGYNLGAISNSHADVTVNGGSNGYVGGLVGYNIGTVSNSYATGAVSSTGNNVGGLVGLNGGAVTNSYATGSVSGSSSNNVGGLVGSSSSPITNSYATGAVSGSSYQVGGLVGNSSATITNSYATGVVSGSDYSVGGLVGASSALITNSHATGAVVGGTGYIGGLVGSTASSGTVTESYATGNVQGAFFVGGLVGHTQSSTITRSYATGNTVAGFNAAGGLVGWAGAGTLLTDVYATGSVYSGNAYSGGLVGYNSATITNAYSSGYVAGVSGVGGLVGFDAGSSTVINSHWNTETSGQSSSVGGTGKTTAEMMQQTTFSSWDFSGTWGIDNGTSYPYLRSLFSGGAQVVSGTATGASNKTVPVVVNGVKLATTNTGADGFYYIALPVNTIANGTALLTYLDDNTGTFLGANVRQSTGGHSTGMDLTTNILRASGSGASMADLVATKGALVDTDIPYTVSGANVATTNGVGFTANSGTGFTVNGNLTASGISLGDTLTLTGNSALDARAGALTLTGGASGAYALTLSSTGNVAQGAAINVTDLNLQGAGGNYALNTQNNDVTSLSGNTGTVRFRDDNGFDVTGLTTSGTTTLSSTGSVTQSGALMASGLSLQGAGSNYQLTGTSNSVAWMAANTDTVNFINSGSLIIWTVDGTNGITATGPVIVETRGAGSNLFLNQGVSSSSGGDAIVLVTPNDFYNIFFSGPGTLSAPNGRWLVYMNSYTSSVEGGLTGAAGSTWPRLYNRSYAANPPGTIGESGNHLIYQQQPMLTVTAADDTRTYGASNPVFSYITSGGYVADDGYADTSAGYVGALSTVAAPTSSVGGYAIARGTLDSAAGYAISFTGGTLTITPAALSVTANNTTKIYDGLPYSGGNGVTYGGFVNGESSSVLGGALAYGGSAQGAVNVGGYTITPSGLTSSNYAIAFNDGALTVSAVNPPPPPIVPPNPAPEPGDNPGMDTGQAKDKGTDTGREKGKSTDTNREKEKSTDTGRAKTKLKIQIVNGGIRLPQEF